MAKKPYLPNNWSQYKNSPDDMFIEHTFEEFMSWKVAGWQMPSSVCCIIRENNLNTGKIKEHMYQRPKAAQNKINSLIAAGESEFTVVNEDEIHHLSPKYLDETNDS